jgi:hypothetical protein
VLPNHPASLGSLPFSTVVNDWRSCEMKVSSATRSAAAFIGTAGIVVPGLAFATATPAGAVTTCSIGSDPVLQTAASIRDGFGTEIGRIGLYFSPSTGCWSGLVTSTFHTAATALVITGGADGPSCFVQPGGSKCATNGGVIGAGNTFARGDVMAGNGRTVSVETSRF